MAELYDRHSTKTLLCYKICEIIIYVYTLIIFRVFTPIYLLLHCCCYRFYSIFAI